ncbi:MAG: hypothetical protein ACK5M1_03925 [Xanthomarina gelatinilytica]|uniref:hypothetical protein n=1 Tax=Xanthomarina gelatinilytica TaxID=1137281 RepID=UPI003A8BB7A9
MIKLKMSLLLCCIVFFSIGCKQKVDQKQVEPIEENINQDSKPKKVFSLRIEAVVKKEDIFSLFYTQYEGENFSGEQMINTKVYASDQVQEITFELPEEDYPLNIRLDFGSNPNQESVIITEFDLKYYNSSYKIKGSELYKYFNFNEGVEMLTDSLTYKLKAFKNESGEKYDPYIVGNDRCMHIFQQEI